ncbi:glutamine synthetase [Candidatus Peregrinibacteria bacterium]|nr:glutamine synthetase [Candidatus Peregrinibacteria bacterium]
MKESALRENSSHDVPLVSPSSLRDFLALSYSELEEINLEMKKLATSGKSEDFLKDKVLKYLQSEKRIKAVTVGFSDIEGRFHMLDYDKKYFLSSYDNLTFDGSSIVGFSAQMQSDLRLAPDWGTFRILPADIFGPGKILMFSFVLNQNGSPYAADFRGRLKMLTMELQKKEGYTVNMAPEIEGFAFEGIDAEQNFSSAHGFKLATRGGYFYALPQDRLRKFIDTVAEAQRAMGFENEKDHGEVAPSQFEINFKYTDVLTACDEIQLYKLTARQVAKLMEMTASFLPKPVMGINGSGMHTNMSISKNGKNAFYSATQMNAISDVAHRFITGILHYAKDLCLVICPSVNSYRRLDPRFEAPNEIKMSPRDRGSMVRIPIGNEKSARIEVRSVAPDANPYLTNFSLIHAGLLGIRSSDKEYAEMSKVLTKKPFPKLFGNIADALRAFHKSKFMEYIMGEENHEKYYAIKKETAMRSPELLGIKVKTAEVIYHHEVRNQEIWKKF